jgi:hypothetical protein
MQSFTHCVNRYAGLRKQHLQISTFFLQDDSVLRVTLAVMKSSGDSVFYTTTTVGGCAADDVDWSSMRVNISNHAPGGTNESPLVVFMIECANADAECPVEWAWHIHDGPLPNSSEPAMSATLLDSRPPSGQAEVILPGAGNETDNLDAHLAYYFASLGKTGDFNTTKQLCLA